MTTTSKPSKSFLSFEHLGATESGRTQVFSVSSGHGQIGLGLIRWYAPWRRYVFYPLHEKVTLLDAGCLIEIANYLQQLMQERVDRR